MPGSASADFSGVPIIGNLIVYNLHVPAIPAAEITAALEVESSFYIRSFESAVRTADGAALSVGNNIIRRWCYRPWRHRRVSHGRLFRLLLFHLLRYGNGLGLLLHFLRNGLGQAWTLIGNNVLRRLLPLGQGNGTDDAD